MNIKEEREKKRKKEKRKKMQKKKKQNMDCIINNYCLKLFYVFVLLSIFFHGAFYCCVASNC